MALHSGLRDSATRPASVQSLQVDVVAFHMHCVWLSAQHVRFVFSVAQESAGL